MLLLLHGDKSLDRSSHDSLNVSSFVQFCQGSIECAPQEIHDDYFFFLNIGFEEIGLVYADLSSVPIRSVCL